MNTEFTVGTKVIIRWNPHHPHLKDILGEVVEFRPRAGFGGEDMVEIGYYDDATYYQRPLSTKFVDVVTRESLLEAAKHHERMAATAREMAEKITVTPRTSL